MAVYKVPQDVEAEDKLIGPFSFRQFVYLIIAVIGIALAWGLAQLFIPLLFIPVPIIIFFGALALPLRKDQPMEIYLAAVVSFYLKPRKRLWQPDGIQSLVEITAPKEIEVQRAKDLTQLEAERRLSYLADIVDTGGWAVRGVETAPVSPMQADAYYDAQQAEDVLDSSGGVSQSFDAMISQSDAKRRQEMVDRMRQPALTVPQRPAQPQPAPIPDPYASLTPTFTPPAQQDPHVTYDPYPASIHQAVVNPLDGNSVVPQPAPTLAVISTPVLQPAAQTQTLPSTTSEKPISPDIINLANNPDLSIETIAHEASRIHQKEAEGLPDEEVMISLR
jgi:hypothetical protein